MGCTLNRNRNTDQDGHVYISPAETPLEDCEEDPLVDDHGSGCEDTGSYVLANIPRITEQPSEQHHGAEVLATPALQDRGKYEPERLAHDVHVGSTSAQNHHPEGSASNAAFDTQQTTAFSTSEHVEDRSESKRKQEPPPPLAHTLQLSTTNPPIHAVSRPMEATLLSPQEDKKRRGAAAYDTLRSNFNTIFPFVNLDTVSHALLPHKVVNPQEIQMFRAAPTPYQQVEQLLFTVMPKVKARPEWFDVFCDALESSAGSEVVKELRDEYRSRYEEQPLHKQRALVVPEPYATIPEEPNMSEVHVDHGAARQDDYVQEPLDCPPSHNEADGNTPLHVSCREGNREDVERLLKSDTDLTCRNKDGETPLHLACCAENIEIALQVASHDPSTLDVPDKNRNTPFHLASTNPGLVRGLMKCTSPDHVAKLIERGNQKGDTPLHLACRHNNLDVVKAILGQCKNVSPHRRNNACFTPLHVAAELGSTDIVEELVRRCPTKEFLNDHMPGETAMHIACRKGHRDVVKLLRKKKASKKVLNKNGEVAADVAWKAGQYGIHEMLTRNRWWKRVAYSKFPRTPSCPSLRSWPSNATINSFSSDCNSVLPYNSTADL